MRIANTTVTVDPDDVIDGVDPVTYGADARTHSLEIYKLYVEMADRISERREKANSFFLAVNTTLIAVLGLSIPSESDMILAERSPSLAVVAAIAGSTLCVLWWRIIASHRQLNSAKFKVVHAIEGRLPIKPYETEWRAVKRGHESELYLPITHVERFVPWVFIALHWAVVLLALPDAPIETPSANVELTPITR